MSTILEVRAFYGEHAHPPKFHGQLAIRTNHQSDASRDMETAILRERIDIGVIETRTVEDGNYKPWVDVSSTEAKVREWWQIERWDPDQRCWTTTQERYAAKKDAGIAGSLLERRDGQRWSKWHILQVVVHSPEKYAFFNPKHI